MLDLSLTLNLKSPFNMNSILLSSSLGLQPALKNSDLAVSAMP